MSHKKLAFVSIFCQKVDLLVFVPTISLYMPKLLAMMTLDVAHVVPWFIGLPFPINTTHASSITSTTTTETFSFTALVCRVLTPTISCGWTIHWKCPFFIFFHVNS
ncbi:hypothetical protein ABFS83_08G203900 [Erythranthe nasuta]